jgi:hypothetical protein
LCQQKSFLSNQITSTRQIRSLRLLTASTPRQSIRSFPGLIWCSGSSPLILVLFLFPFLCRGVSGSNLSFRGASDDEQGSKECDHRRGKFHRIALPRFCWKPRTSQAHRTAWTYARRSKSIGSCSLTSSVSCLYPCPSIRSVAGPTGAQRIPYRARPESDKPSCVKSTGSTAPQVRRVACVVLRLAYDPLPIPGGLLPRRHLRRFSGIFPHVADREPLDPNSLLRLLYSHLELYQVSTDSPSCLMANRQFEVFDAPSMALTCAFLAHMRFSQASLWFVFTKSSSAFGTTLRNRPTSAGTIDTIASTISFGSR